MELGLIFGVVLILLILTFGTLTIVFSLKSWHWLHITAFCLLLVTLPPAMYYMAAYAKTAQAWGAVYNDKNQKLAAAKTTNLELTVGKPPMSAKPVEMGRIQAVAALDRLLLQRGRVWRNCTASAFAAGPGGAFISKVTTLPPNVPPADVAKFKNGIAPQSEVFIFRQIPDAANQLAGYAYLGRFGVLAATESDIDVTPYDVLDAQQAAAFGPNNYLTIYETLPTDDNSVFDDLTGAEREAAIRAIFAPMAPGGAAPVGLNQEEFDALVTSFIRHGGEKLETDTPDEIFTKIKFIDERPVDVDAASIPGADSQLFDSLGRAIRGSLRRDPTKPLVFKKGDEVTIASSAADELIREGKAEKIGDVYQRAEYDFDASFRIFAKQAIDTRAEISKIERNMATMQETAKRLESEIAYRTKEKGMLESDLVNFQNDAKVMTQAAEELTASYNKLLDRLSELYRGNQDMLAKIAEVDAKLTEQIDKATSDATAAR